MQACPSLTSLRSLFGESADSAVAERLRQHVGGCVRCRRQFEQFAAETLRASDWPPRFRLERADEVLCASAEFISEPTAAERFPEVPGYRIFERLGQGGMGVVYKAQHVELNRLVALKMLHSGPAFDPEMAARFRKEAEALASLQHPNIVQIHDIGTHQGLPYFAMEFVAGGDLAQQLDGKPLAPRGRPTGLALARAIDAAHREGIVHRDLKPANILLTEPEARNGKRELGEVPEHVPLPGPRSALCPKIADFGLAKRFGAARTFDNTLTQAGDIVGTPNYMAPNRPAASPRRISARLSISTRLEQFCMKC